MITYGITVVVLLATCCCSQAPNTLAPTHPNQRTESANETWMIVPVDRTKVQSVVPYPLLPVPTSDKTLFPKGFPANKHPVLTSAGYMNDIRRGKLYIPNLLGASIYFPFVDRLKDGKTPFNYPVRNYIGGVNGKDVQGLVPALVGTLEGTPIQVATFDPNTEAYRALPGGVFSQTVKEVITPQPPSGPAVKPPAFDQSFETTKHPLYTDHTFHSLINQATILSNGLCQRNEYFFNYTFTDPIMRIGNVTIYGEPNGAAPAAIGNTYTNVGGLSATAEQLGFDAQTCQTAAAQVDPAASA